MIGNIVSAIGNVFRFHKLKILATTGFFLFFGFLIFPFDDLSDVISAKISEVTNGAYYVHFEDFSVNVIPSIGISMENVMVESQTIPAMKAGHVELSPWILGALTGRQGAAIDAGDVFGGVIVADIREGEKSKSGGERVKAVAINAKDVNLGGLTTFLRDSGIFGLGLQGTASIDTNLSIDPLFDAQPSGTIDLQAAGLTLPAQTFSANMNGAQVPVELSELKLGATKFVGKMENGVLDISELTFGSSREVISGKAKGNFGLQFKQITGRTVTTPGAYDVRVDLTIRKEFVNNSKGSAIGMGLGFLPKPVRETADGFIYAFRVQGQPGQPMPTISPL